MLSDRFWSRVRKTSSCWHWVGGCNVGGYGMFCLDGRDHLAHRLAYEDAASPIPNGFQVHHTCRNKGCVNPKHLQAMSRAEHMAQPDSSQAINAAKTHCPRGHEYTKANTRLKKWRGTVSRACGQCRRDYYVANHETALAYAKVYHREHLAENRAAKAIYDKAYSKKNRATLRVAGTIRMRKWRARKKQEALALGDG